MNQYTSERVEVLFDEVAQVADFLVGNGDVAEFAAKRLRTTQQKLDAYAITVRQQQGLADDSWWKEFIRLVDAVADHTPGRDALIGHVAALAQNTQELRQENGPVDENLVEAFKALYRAYVQLLENARDRMRDLGLKCDPIDVMEHDDPHLIQARRALQATLAWNAQGEERAYIEQYEVDGVVYMGLVWGRDAHPDREYIPLYLHPVRVRVPEGMVLVPREPTEAQLNRAIAVKRYVAQTGLQHIGKAWATAIYEAMLNAVPSRPSKDPAQEEAEQI